jgi:hypothetical protein
LIGDHRESFLSFVLSRDFHFGIPGSPHDRGASNLDFEEASG